MAAKLVIFTQTEYPRIYLTQKSVEELTAIFTHSTSGWQAWIQEIKMAESQTPNEFGGAYLVDPIRILPQEYMKACLENYLQQWDGCSKEQVQQEAARACKMILMHRDKFLNSIKQEEQHPQTEVVEVKEGDN